MKHPAAQDALRYIKSRSNKKLAEWMDTFHTENTELSYRCYGSLAKVINNKEVEDIDILGLAYVMKQGECG